AYQHEIMEGRGDTFSGTSCVWLDLTQLGEDVINERLPTVRDLGRTFAGIDPVEKPIPVVPTCHYQIGGIPTNKHGQVITKLDGKDKV
ncbi:FAD-binding protein, partial [Francisella tularensis]|uniref:FAD-binding protein n=1 Tax=Francisella tularensis TaxID=263 RepID=UPI002381BD3A